MNKPDFVRNGIRSLIACLVASWIALSCAAPAHAQQYREFNDFAGNEDVSAEVKEAFSRGEYPWYDAAKDAANFQPATFDGSSAETSGRNKVPKAKQRNQSTTSTAASERFWMIFWVVVLVVVLAVLGAAAIWLIVRMDPPSGFRDQSASGEDGRSYGSDRVESLPFEMKKKSGDFRAEAEAAYRQGNYRLAVTYLFSHVLLTLDRHRHIRLRRGITNRQYLNELKSSQSIPLVAYYESLMISFESAFFGNHELEKSRFEASWNALPDFESRVNQLAQATSSTKAAAITTVILLLCLTGCNGSTTTRETTIETGYGRKSGNSLNGTAILANLVRQSGRKVGRADSITPQMDRYERIIWFRNRFEPPSEESIEAMDEWLAYGYNRQLIIVGRDYDSAVDYWEGVAASTKGKDHIRARRRLAKAKAEFQSQRTAALEASECDWYTVENHDFQKASQLSGPMSRGINASQSDVQVGIMISPTDPPQSMPWDERYDVDTKLLADGKPLVTVLSKDIYDGGEIYLVSNASFLTNYGLVNHENRKLAKRLLESQRYNDGATLFLETGDRTERVSSSNADHQTWAWITKPPLRYIVPHFLVLGVVFCFVLYPIFGRARKANAGRDNTSFRDHIRAMGKMLANSGHFTYAQDKLKKYTNRHWKEHEK